MHAEQNQIINLTARYSFYKELSGCVQTPIIPTTAKPYYTISVPTAPSRKKKFTATIKSVLTTNTYHVPELNAHYTTTDIYQETSSILSSTTFNDFVEEFNYTTTAITTTERDLSLDFEELDSDRKEKDIGRIRRAILPTVPVKSKRVICRNARRFRSSRERWWFVAISNCNASKGIHIKYKILMTNGPQGDYWHEHFSADKFCKCII